MNIVLLPSRCFLLLCLLALGLAACKSNAPSSPPSAKATEARISVERTASAKVVALDKEARCATLRTEEDQLLDVIAGPGVRNFEQIAVGDSLRVRYSAAVKATRRPAGKGAEPARGVAVASRAAKGQKPGGGVEVAVRLGVRIESIDVPHDIVVFSLASGDLVAHRIATPQGREFVKSLSVGEAVQLDYDAAMALSIERVEAGK